MKAPVQYIDKAFTVFVDVDGATEGSVINFPDVPTLRDREILGLCSLGGTVNNDVKGNAVITGLQEQSFYLNLIDADRSQFYENVPLEFINSKQTSTTWKYFVPPRVINWQQCTLLRVSSGSLPKNARVGIMFIYK